jgi:DNA-directed RNA polymerase subunit K/omega
MMSKSLEESKTLDKDGDKEDEENDATSSVDGSGSDSDNDDDDDDNEVDGSDVSEKDDEENGGSENGSEVDDDENPSALNSILNSPIGFDGGEDEEDEDEDYLQKFDKELTEKYIAETHPETLIHNFNEILALSKVVRDENNIIVDEFHKTIPMLTKYEKTRIIGQRSKQLNQGSNPFIPVSENILDTYIIAEMELKEKRLPFIIRRPIPNGSSEYWRLEDLELL